MSDLKKENIDNEEFQNKKVSNSLPDIDETILKNVNNKGKNIRNFDNDIAEDNLIETESIGFQLPGEEMQENKSDNTDDIINSLIDYSSQNKDSSTKENESIGMFGKLSKKKKPKNIKQDNNILPEKNKKGFSLFKKKDIKPLDENNEKSSLQKEDELNVSELTLDNNTIETSDSVIEDDININTFDDIQKSIRTGKSGTLKNNKIFLIICIVIFSAIVVVVLASTIMKSFQLSVPSVDENTLVETIETGEIDTKNSSTETVIEKQGYIKRILGDKIVIVPDDETEDIIYYMSDINLTNDIVAGAHIQYGYKIINYIPYISTITEIKTGEVIYKGIMTINVMVNNSTLKFSYLDELEQTMKGIRTGDEISYVSKDIEGVPTITNIIKINGTTNSGSDTTYKVEDVKNPVTDDLYSGYVFNKDDFYEEYLIVNNRPEETRVVTKTNLENNSLKFYSGITDPIWIRFAWRVTDIATSVPNIENVDLILETPSGIKITQQNIDTYGRMWIDGNIVNYALKTPEIGEYKITTNKPKGTNLGEAEVFILGLSGFITIDKFGANLIDRDNLELIWNIGGVPDDGIEIEVYLTNDRFSTMIYSGSSKTEILHTVDRRVVSIANLPKGKYNILVKVKDLDLKTQADSPDIPENTIKVSAETITDTKNVGILILQ